MKAGDFAVAVKLCDCCDSCDSSHGATVLFLVLCGSGVFVVVL